MKQRIVPKSRILPDLALVASRPQPLSRAVHQFSFCSGWHSLDATTMSSNPPAIVGMSESAQTLHQPSVEIFNTLITRSYQSAMAKSWTGSSPATTLDSR